MTIQDMLIESSSDNGRSQFIPHIECGCAMENRLKIFINPEYEKLGNRYVLKKLKCEGCNNKWDQRMRRNTRAFAVRIEDNSEYKTF
jgi:hypothetical protein